VRRVLGIDPGLNGAFCILTIHSDGVREPVFHPFPKINGNEIDFDKLRYFFSCFQDCFAVIEKVHAMPGQGVSSMFRFGRVFGALQSSLNMFQLDYIEVTPQAWQKELHEGIDRELDPKARSLIAAKKLYPDANLLATARSRVPHDGFVDALLLAEYGRRHFPTK
jgi:hypothetical protein